MKYMLIFLLVACATFKKKPPAVSSKEIPEWAYSPQTGCSEEMEICVSGEGLSAKEADAHALSALAAVFETKVSQSFSHVQTSQQLSATIGQVKESQSSSLRTDVDQYLQAVQFKQRFYKNKLHYVWASIDKKKISSTILSSVKKIDDELMTLWDQKSRTSFRGLLSLLFQRETLSSRLSLLDELVPPSRVNIEQILKWQKSLPEKKMTLKGEMPDWLKDKLKSMLTEVKIIIVAEASESIDVKWERKQEFLKVSGFSKWSYILTLKYINVAVGNKGTLNIQQVASGRSEEDAELKLKQGMVVELEQNLNRLNIE
jgi:hypothetical protein